MANVEFSENIPTFTSRRLLGDEVTPKMTNLLIKVGLASSPIAAKRVMIGIIALCFLGVLFIIYLSFFRGSTERILPNNPTPEQIRNIMDNPKSFKK
ncbi:MAG: hypothetical protein V4481_05010 [Patescibacteria group bacterium]